MLQKNCVKMTALEIENALLCRTKQVQSSDIIRYALEGNYFHCIKNCFTKFKFSSDICFYPTIPELSLPPNSSVENKLEYFSCAISCLQLFVQNNWTGPFNGLNFIKEMWGSTEDKNASKETWDTLEQDGETINENAKCLPFLVLAYSMLQTANKCTELQTAPWWLLRCITVYQKLLTDRSPTLMKLSEKCLERISSNNYFNNITTSLKIQLNLEAGLISLFYYKYEIANEYFIKATTTAGLQCSLTGDLGVRTRFQTKPVSQLRLNIKKNTDYQSTIPTIDELPKALMLNNETLLEEVKFINDVSENPNLTPEDQAVILAYCTHMTKTKPSQALDKEEINAVLSSLVSQPKCWVIQSEVLKLRSLLENERTKTVERSMMQMETLVNDVRLKIKDEADLLNRLDLIYSVWRNPIWDLEKDLAKLFMSLGATSSALEIYLRLHMWNDAILCLIMTGRGEEAKKLVYEQLQMNETPRLWCLLGDILGDSASYEKAWETSKYRSAQAMRSLGAYYVSKKNHTKAIECFEKSLEVNELHVGTLFNLGCAYMVVNDYKNAAKSYKRCTSLNWDNFEAWTNLSTCFIRCDEKDKAFRTLKEALRCNFNQWQIWENYVTVCTDTGHFNEAISAYHKLLEIKEKYFDIQILTVLVKVVDQNIPSFNGIFDKKLKQKVLELLGKISSKSPSEWKVWLLYAEINGYGIIADVDNTKIIGYLQKALRYATYPNWEKDNSHYKNVLNVGKLLIQSLQYCLKNQTVEIETIKPIAMTIKLSVNGIISTLKKYEKNVIKQEFLLEVQNLVNSFENDVKNPLWDIMSSFV